MGNERIRKTDIQILCFTLLFLHDITLRLLPDFRLREESVFIFYVTHFYSENIDGLLLSNSEAVADFER